MNFEVKKDSNITIFKLNEARLETNISGLLKGEFTMLLKVEGANKFILDLSNVESCDSSGLSAILVANRILNTTGGQMRIDFAFREGLWTNQNNSIGQGATSLPNC